MLQLRQTQGLQQRLTPQQVQYLKLLQLPILSLEQRIKSEIEENPMLEEASEEEEQLETTPEDRVEAQAVDISDPIVDAAGGTPGSVAESGLSAEERAERLRAEREERTRDEANNDYSFEDFMNDDTEGWKAPTAAAYDEDREEMPHA